MKMRRICLVSLVLVLLTLALTLAASAETPVTDATFSSVVMNVGKDESERNLTWYSNYSASGEIRYAESGDGKLPSEYKTAKAVAVKTTSGLYAYKATMVGLDAGKTYVYRLVVGDTVSDPYTFSVEGADDGFIFAFITDAQVKNSTDGAGWRATLDSIYQMAPDVALIVSGGDQTSDPLAEGNYKEFLSPMLTGVPISTTVGPSHDNAAPFGEHYNLPNLSSTYGVSATSADYSYTYGSVLFMHLNVENSDYAGHTTFMQNAIADHPECLWRVVVIHYSFYSAGSHSTDGAVNGFRNALAGEFCRLGVDLVLSGHDHVYSRSQLMVNATTVSSDTVVNNTVTDPEGTLYLCGTCPSGSGYYDGYNTTFAPYIAKHNDENRRGMVLFEVSDGALVMKSYFVDSDTPELMDEFTVYKTDSTPAPEAEGYDVTFVADPDARFGDATDLSAYTARTYTAATPDAPSIFMPKGSLAEGALYEWSWVYYTVDGERVDSFVKGESYLAYLAAKATPVSNTMYIAMQEDPQSYTYTWATAWNLVTQFAAESFTLKLAEDVTLSSTDAVTLLLSTNVTLDLAGHRLDGSAVSNGILVFSTGSSGSAVSLITSVEGGTVACGTKSVFYLNSNSSSSITIAVGSASTHPVTVSSCAYLVDAGNNFKNNSKLYLTVTGGSYTVTGGITKVTNLKETSGKDTYLLNFKDATVNLGGASANVIGQYGTGRNAHSASKLVADGCTFRNAYDSSVRSFLAVDCFEGAMSFTDCTFDGVSLDAKGHSLASAISVGAGCAFQNSGATLSGNPLTFAGANTTVASGCVIARTDAMGSVKVVKKADAAAITWANPVGYTDYWTVGATPVYLGETAFTAGNNAFTLVLADEPVVASGNRTYAFTTPEGYLFRLDGGVWQVSYDNGASYNDLAAASYAISVDVDGTVTNYGASTDLATLLSELDASGAKNIKVTLGNDTTLAALSLKGGNYKLSIDLAGYTMSLSGTLQIDQSGKGGVDIHIYSSSNGGKLSVGSQRLQVAEYGSLTLGSEEYKNYLTVTTSGDYLINLGTIDGNAVTIRCLYSTISTGKYGLLRLNARGANAVTLLAEIVGCTVTTKGSAILYNASSTLNSSGNGGVFDADSVITIKNSSFTTTASSAGLFGHGNFTDRYYGKVHLEGSSFTGYTLNGDLILSDASVSYTYNTYYQNLPSDYDPTKCITVGKGCTFSNYGTTFNAALDGFAASNASLASGYILSVNGGTVEVVEAPPASATFEFFDVAYGEIGSASVIAKLVAFLGEMPEAPVLAIRKVGEKFYGVKGWTVYDGTGKELGALGKVTEAMDGKSYVVCPVWGEVTVAFAIVEGGAYDYKMAEDFTAASVDGKTVVLLADLTAEQTFTNATIDLKGYTLTSNVQLTASGCYVYNSNTERTATIHLVGALINGGTRDVYVGYKNADTPAEGRIVMVLARAGSGASGYKNSVYYNNVDVVGTVKNEERSTVLGQMQGHGTYYAVNCNFYLNEYGILVNMNKPEGGTVTLKNCNVYFANGGKITGGGGQQGKYTSQTVITLDNVHVYGATEAANDEWDFVLKNGTSFHLSPCAEGHGTLAEGTVLVPINETKSVTFSYVKADGTAATFEGTYGATVKVGTERDLKALFATFYRNVSLDVDINFNLYIPTTYTLAGEYDTVVIGGAEYYVVTVKTAPKDATGDHFITLTIGGVEVAYNASLVDYMGALLNLPTTAGYVEDSQKMAKYVLYYVKSAALNAYGEVDTDEIDKLLKGFVLTEKDKELGNVQTSTPIAGITGATLDLNSSVGIVFRVEKGYHGTLTVTFNGKTTTYNYTANAAGDEEYIVIDGIEAFKFTGNVVVTNSEGESFTYNVATYVEDKKTDVAYAVYAYAVQATVYNATYGTPDVID